MIPNYDKLDTHKFLWSPLVAANNLPQPWNSIDVSPVGSGGSTTESISVAMINKSDIKENGPSLIGKVSWQDSELLRNAEEVSNVSSSAGGGKSTDENEQRREIEDRELVGEKEDYQISSSSLKQKPHELIPPYPGSKRNKARSHSASSSSPSSASDENNKNNKSGGTNKREKDKMKAEKKVNRNVSRREHAAVVKEATNHSKRISKDEKSNKGGGASFAAEGSKETARSKTADRSRKERKLEDKPLSLSSREETKPVAEEVIIDKRTREQRRRDEEKKNKEHRKKMVDLTRKSNRKYLDDLEKERSYSETVRRRNFAEFLTQSVMRRLKRDRSSTAAVVTAEVKSPKKSDNRRSRRMAVERKKVRPDEKRDIDEIRSTTDRKRSSNKDVNDKATTSRHVVRSGTIDEDVHHRHAAAKEIRRRKESRKIEKERTKEEKRSRHHRKTTKKSSKHHGHKQHHGDRKGRSTNKQHHQQQRRSAIDDRPPFKHIFVFHPGSTVVENLSKYPAPKEGMGYTRSVLAKKMVSDIRGTNKRVAKKFINE